MAFEQHKYRMILRNTINLCRDYTVCHGIDILHQTFLSEGTEFRSLRIAISFNLKQYNNKKFIG